MRRLASILVVALTAYACASSPAGGSPPSCSWGDAEADVARKTIGVGPKVVGEMADRCTSGQGIIVNCNPANILLLPIGLFVAPFAYVGAWVDRQRMCSQGATAGESDEGTNPSPVATPRAEK